MRIGQEQLRHLLLGAAFFSTGGGGSLEAGLELISGIGELELLDVDEVLPSQVCATAYLVGSITSPALTELREKSYDVVIEKESDLVVHAFDVLREKFREPIDFIVPVELGGHNTAVSLYVAAEAGLPVLDADLTGRSAPEMYQTGYYVGDISPTPAGVFTPFGERLYVESVHDYKRFDDFLRELVDFCYGFDVGVANFPLPIAEAKPYIVKYSLSRCIDVGILLDQGEVEEAIKVAKGKVIFRGKTVREEYEVKRGFTFGSVYIEGKGGLLRLEYKNEILVAFLNDEPVASVPDLIGVVSTAGKPIVNAKYKRGEEVIVFTVPSPEIWRTERGFSVFSPEHFGYHLNN